MDLRKTVRLAEAAAPCVVARPVIVIGAARPPQSSATATLRGAAAHTRGQPVGPTLPPAADTFRAAAGWRALAETARSVPDHPASHPADGSAADAIATVTCTLATAITRPRARVELDPAMMQQLAAEIWARQAPPGATTRVTTLRATVLDVSDARDSVPSTPPWQAMNEYRTVVRGLLRGRVRLKRSARIGAGVLLAISLGLAAARLAERLEAGDAGPVPQSAAAPASQEPRPSVPATATLAQRSAALPSTEQTPSASAAVSGGYRAYTRPSAPAAIEIEPRAAVDALLAGQPELAAAHYRALAEQNPDQPAYAEAARILEEIEAK